MSSDILTVGGTVMCAVTVADACLENNGGCSHTCIDTYVSHICTCPQGYQLSDDARICEGSVTD